MYVHWAWPDLMGFGRWCDNRYKRGKKGDSRTEFSILSHLASYYPGRLLSNCNNSAVVFILWHYGMYEYRLALLSCSSFTSSHFSTSSALRNLGSLLGINPYIHPYIYQFINSSLIASVRPSGYLTSSREVACGVCCHFGLFHSCSWYSRA